MKKENKPKRSVLGAGIRIVAGAVLLLVLAVAGYIIYMQVHYYRIEDHLALEIENNPDVRLETGRTYTAVTYNIGFGAYGPDYSFFMDTGEMKDGTPTTGKYGKAVSEEAVEENTEGVIKELGKLDADFMLCQEVDTDAEGGIPGIRKCICE